MTTSPAVFAGGAAAPVRFEKRTVRPAALEDALALAQILRPADVAELAALGQRPLAALEDAIAASPNPWAAVDPDGVLIALFGAAPMPGAPAVGAPWMLASPRLDRAARPFLRASRDWVAALQADYDLLFNRVDERNCAHIAWLRWCGFSFLRRVELGPRSLPFWEFVRLGDPS